MTSLIIPLPFVLLNLEKVKRNRKKYKKFEYLESKRSFLDEIKNIFQFLKGYHLVKKKKKNMIKIADTSFKNRLTDFFEKLAHDGFQLVFLMFHNFTVHYHRAPVTPSLTIFALVM